MAETWENLFSEANSKYADIRLPGSKDPVGIITWSMPAFHLNPKYCTKPIGRWRPGDIVCPQAFMCIRGCYARQGMQNMPNTILKHNRAFLQSQHPDFVLETIKCIMWFLAKGVKPSGKPRRPLDFVRIHDSGEFYDEPYLMKWLEIVKHFRTASPNLKFWAYTKQVLMVKKHYSPEAYPNLSIVFSEGGWQDDDIDESRDRFSRVFVSMKDLQAQGFADGGSEQSGDVAACFGSNRKVGLVFHPPKRKPFTTDPESEFYLPSVKREWEYVNQIKFVPAAAGVNPRGRRRR